MIELSIAHVPRYGPRLTMRTPFRYKEICKALAGVHWEPDMRVWHVPATPGAAVAVVAALAEHGAVISDDVHELIRRGGQAERLRAIGPEDMAPIPLTVGTPWHHQVRGFHMLVKQDASMLAWDMGTGKSRTVIDVVQNLQFRRTLILCPTSVVAVWPSQFAKHLDPDLPTAHHATVLPLRDGTVIKRAQQLIWALKTVELGSTSPLVTVINYEAAYREPLASLLLRTKWDMIVADESHRIKAPGGIQSKFLAKVGKCASKRVCLTGTPMPHDPLDAYAQYRFLDPGIFGTSFTAFRAEFAVMGGFENHEILEFRNLDKLNRLFFSIGDRVMKDEVLDLPPAVHEVRSFALSAKGLQVYEGLSRELVADIEEGTVTAANVLARLLRLQQVTSGYATIKPVDASTATLEARDVTIDTGKRDVLKDLLKHDMIAEPVIVFCRFRYDLDQVHAVANELNRPSCELSGRRKEIGAIWQPTAADTVAAVQIHSGGVGVDFTAARFAVHYSVGFDRGDYEQSMARLHRQGQNFSVTYFRIVAERSIDEKIYQVFEGRAHVVRTLMEAFGKRDKN